jgi:hypothetical protein
MRQSVIFRLVPFMLCSASFAIGQGGIAPLTVSGSGLVRYPSLQPISTINLSLADNGAIVGAIQNAANNSTWSCVSTKFYTVEIVNGSGTPSEVPVASVTAQGNDPVTGRRFTHCDGSGQPGTVYLTLAMGIPATAKLRVTLFLDASHKTTLAQSDGTLTLESAEKFTFSATPQSAPGEALNNGQKRDVGQLTVSIADTDIVRNPIVNLYAKSSDLFSTDSKDSKSAFSALLGIRRGIFRNWYTPWQLEQSIQGNQTASNLSAVTNLGFTTLVPWKWSRPMFNNEVIGAPLPPDITVSNQYTHRISQLVTEKTPLLETNDYSLNPSLSWSSITFPPTCKVFSWLSRQNTKDPPYCLGTEINLGLWYLPLDLTKNKSQRAEGYGDVSMLLPLAGFNFASALFPYVTSNDPTKVQIRIKYSDSVNAANNYARIRAWTYGLEILK